MKKLVIRNPDECVAATKRADALEGAAPESDAAAERQILLDAIRFYEDAITMMRGVGRKAADEPEEGVPNGSGSE